MSAPGCWTRRAVLGLLPIAAVATAAPAPAPEAAAAFVRRLGERAFAVLRRRDLDRAGKLRALEVLVEEATDLELLARLVLGRYWRRATPAQRARFVDLFRRLLRKSLAERLDDYGGQTLEVVGAEPVGRADVLVHTRVRGPGTGKALAVDWRVRRRNGRFVVIDVIAEGVSLLITQRSQVAEVIGREGIDGLLRVLEERLRRPGGPTPSPRPS